MILDTPEAAAVRALHAKGECPDTCFICAYENAQEKPVARVEGHRHIWQCEVGYAFEDETSWLHGGFDTVEAAVAAMQEYARNL